MKDQDDDDTKGVVIHVSPSYPPGCEHEWEYAEHKDPVGNIAAEPTKQLPAWQDVLGDAEMLVRQKFIFSKYIKGTILENDVPVWIADFALRLLQRDRAALAAVPSHCKKCGMSFTRYIFTECP
jgi:hypothetical protein